MTEDKKQDIYIYNSIYPDAEGLFSFRPKSLEVLKKDSLVVLDTNTLLVPFSVSANSIKEIGQTYRRLVKQERLYIPGQVAREFAKNRTNKLSELFQQLSRKKNNKHTSQGNYPLLEGNKDYQEVLRIEHELSELESEYFKSINKVLETIRQWGWNDPVSSIYRDLFSKGVVYDPELNKEQITKDLEKRQIHKLPPGYKDASKDDLGIGDLLIWHTILELAKQKKKNVLFISGDLKPDWWCQSEGQALYLRHELVDEFRRNSDGQTLGIIKFSEFMSLFGANEFVVEEVKNEESNVSVLEELFRKDVFEYAAVVENSIVDWLEQKHGKEAVKRNQDKSLYCDLILEISGEKNIGIELIAFSSKAFPQYELKWRRKIIAALRSQYLSEYKLIFFLSGTNDENWKEVLVLTKSIVRMNIKNLSMVCGVLEGDKFVPLNENENE